MYIYMYIYMYICTDILCRKKRDSRGCNLLMGHNSITETCLNMLTSFGILRVLLCEVFFMGFYVNKYVYSYLNLISQQFFPYFFIESERYRYIHFVSPLHFLYPFYFCSKCFNGLIILVFVFVYVLGSAYSYILGHGVVVLESKSCQIETLFSLKSHRQRPQFECSKWKEDTLL